MRHPAKILLGMRIQEIRKLRRLTQSQLSEIIDIDAKHISRIEVGRSYPSLDTLGRLAKALQVEMNTFFEFDHNGKSKRELRDSISELLKYADKDKLLSAVKVLKALMR